MRRLSALFLAGFCQAALLRAAAPSLEIIDTPTAEVADHYGYQASFRFYSGGGVLSKTTFGVFPRLNVGFGLDAERLVGADTVDVNRPTLNVRFRFFDADRYLPALALGYDGQGYFFDEKTDEYLQREKGLYAVGSGEIATPGLTMSGGAYIYDFSEDEVYAFSGLSYLVRDVFAFNAEVDNIRRARHNRINLGGRYHLSPGFSIEMAGRDLFAPGRKAERIVRLVYFGSF
ncbi:MAG: hypothetical protein ACT4O3_01060 [Elusimicrobiota bacterium]